MRIEQLKYLLDLENTKSMNATANRFFVSQPALSKAITGLETEIGHTLLLRNKKGVALTDSGRLVIEASRKIVDIYETLQAQLKSLEPQCLPEISGKISLGATTVCDVKILQNFMPNFHRHYPNIITTIQVSRRLDVKNMVTNDSVDLAISQSLFGLKPDDNQQFNYIDILLEPFSAMIHKTSPLYQKKTICIDDIVDEPLIFFNNSGETQSDVEVALAAYLQQCSVINTGSLTHFCQLLSEEHYLTIISNSMHESMVQANPKLLLDYKLVTIKEGFSQKIQGFYKKSHVLSESEQIFIEQLQQYMNRG